jgi:hypothetical protein
MEDWKTAQLKAAYKASDTNGNGKLDFDEFLGLLKKGNENFPLEEAEQLFQTADQDLSAEVDFEEFVDYIYDTSTVSGKLFRLDTSAAEEYAKEALMAKPAVLRRIASKAAKKSGVEWGKMTWVQRLQEVCDLEKEEAEDTQVRAECAPIKDSTSHFVVDANRSSPKRRRHKSQETGESMIEEQLLEKEQSSRSAIDEEEATAKVMQKVNQDPDVSVVSSVAGSKIPLSMSKALPSKKFAIAEMSQEELVNYSLTEEDLEFAGNDPQAKEDLRQIKEHLKTAPDPSTVVNVIKFIAKGTAGWVFLCERKDTGKKVAMKLIRMTQARSGIKEWYMSQRLRDVEGVGIVQTEPDVCVCDRSKADEVIQAQLQNAGPVPFYMAMFQQLMPWGTLEDLSKTGELTPLIMFRTLEDVAETLNIMHQNNLQHRDVKPENVMLQMTGNTVVSAKLCDFGSSEMGDNQKGREDDIRRFGLTFFSVASGEGWTKNRLLKQPHADLVSRMADVVQGNPALAKLPEVLQQMLDISLNMEQIEDVMEDLEKTFAS